MRSFPHLPKETPFSKRAQPTNQKSRSSIHKMTSIFQSSKECNYLFQHCPSFQPQASFRGSWWKVLPMKGSFKLQEKFDNNTRIPDYNFHKVICELKQGPRRKSHPYSNTYCQLKSMMMLKFQLKC